MRFMTRACIILRFREGPKMVASLPKVFALGVVIGLALLVDTRVQAQEGKTIVVEGQRDKNSRKICKATEPPTGTRLGARRICRTATEWKIIEKRSQETVELAQQRQRAMDAYKQNQKNALASPGPP